MRLTYRLLLLISVFSLLLHFALLVFIHSPGLNDALHYYNLGRSLAQGDGFQINYVWHYLRSYDSLTHPIDYWMPLTGMLAGLSMYLFGINYIAALLPILLLGGLVPVLTYSIARGYQMKEETSLIAAALSASLPEIIWQSTRLLTTTLNIYLVSISILLFVVAVQKGRWYFFVGSGIFAGLAYLNRTDAILLFPMLIVSVLLYLFIPNMKRFSRRQWFYLLLMPFVAFFVTLPWLLRNQAVLGQMSMAETSRIFFMIEYNDHHSYDNSRITLERLLAEQTISQIVSKRIFELAAAFKQIGVSLTIFGTIAVLGGLVLLLWNRETSHLAAIAPTLILLLGILIVYPILIPMKSQGGSFRTAFATLIPLLLPLGAYAIHQAITDSRIRLGFVILLLIFNALASIELIRADSAFNDNYLSLMQNLVRKIDELPDVNGDGEVRIMSQDPLVLSYLGKSSALVPNGTRNDIVAVARQYGIDYVMLPTAWTDLDKFYGLGHSDDPRFVFTAKMERADHQPFEFYAILTDKSSNG